jgi:hypothetical protein
MSPDQELLNLAGAESESKTLFDELAGLVPAERLAEYYRVIAHTRTLGPNDEMLRLLEAMGLLALLTRETPAEIAAERKSLQKILESSASQANVVEKRMAGYASHLESRLAQLPKELETGLDPPRIAKLLGESLRQCFQQSGLPDTARALDQSCSEMNSVQTQLVNVLREVAHPDIGSRCTTPGGSAGACKAPLTGGHRKGNRRTFCQTDGQSRFARPGYLERAFLSSFINLSVSSNFRITCWSPFIAASVVHG